MSHTDSGFGRSNNILGTIFGRAINNVKDNAFFDLMYQLMEHTSVNDIAMCASLWTYISDSHRTSGMRGTFYKYNEKW